MSESTIITLLDSHGLGAVVLVVVVYLARRAPVLLDRTAALTQEATALVRGGVVLVGRLSDLAEVGTVALQSWLRDRGETDSRDSGEVKIARKVAQGRIDEVRAELEQLDEGDSLHGRLGQLAGEIARLEREARAAARTRQRRITVVPTRPE